MFPIDAIESGESILFLGAGFSREARSRLREPIRSAWELSDYLLDECGVTDKRDYDLETASEEYASKKGEPKLIEILHDNFVSTDIADSQRTIICQPWYRIYTANYDDVVERISHIDNKPVSLKEISDTVEPPTAGVTQLIHIHGNITRVAPQEFRRTFLLTEAQRDNSPFLRSPWLWRFNDDVLAAPAIFFVGFSLRDIDLRRLLGLLPPQVKGKTYFVDSPSAPRPTQLRLQKFGQLSLVGVDGFAAALGSKRFSKRAAVGRNVPRSIDELHFHRQARAAVTASDISI